MSAETEGLPIPVTVPHGAESAALLTRIAEAVEKVAENATKHAPAVRKATEDHADALKRLEEGAKGARESVGSLAERYVFITQAIDDFTSRIERVAELAAEQENLSEQSANLGLDFDRAAAAAGRFADETEAMATAGRFASTELHLTQTELDAVMRVAGASSRQLGVTTSTAVNMLTEALIRGREAGLQRFGTELAAVSGSAHSVDERLAALVTRANHVAAATDNSADAMKRLRDRFDDYKRSAATAFTEELTRLTSLGGSAHTTAGDMQNLAASISAVGSTIGTMAAMVIGSIRLLVTETGSEISRFGHFLHLVSDDTNNMWSHMRDDALDNLEQQYADRNGEGPGDVTRAGQSQTDYVRTPQGVIDRINRHEALPDGWDVRMVGGRLRAVRTGGSEDDRSTTGHSAQGSASADTARSLRDGVSYQPRNATEEAQLRAREADASARNARENPDQPRAAQRGGGGHVDDSAARKEAALNALMGRVFERPGLGGTERQSLLDLATNAANDNGDGLAKSAAERAAQEAAFASSDEGRGIAAQRERNAARERRQQDQRLDALRTFTDRWEDLHSRQANATQMAADTASKAFDLMGQGLAKHIELLAQGKESVGEAARAFTAELLTNLGHEAIAKGAMEFAEGLASLATPVTAPLAAGHFAASAAFISAGALMSGLGAAVAPSAPSASGARGGAAGGRASLPSSASSAASSEPVTHVYNYYAPTYGGREGSRAETGVMVQRDLRAADARLQREAA